MQSEKRRFEEHGLVLDQERVLIYSKLHCPLECKYCFVNDIDYNQQANVSYLSEDQFELIENLPDEITLVMLGCDTEFFQKKQEAIQILERLSAIGRDISVITKLSLSEDYMKRLKEIAIELRHKNNLLAFSVSITCMDSARLWEPYVPSPGRRIRTLRDAFEDDIKTMVAIRPLIPTISDDELRQLIEQTKDYCCGYYSGPLYLKNNPQTEFGNTADLTIEQLQPHWMPPGNFFYKLEKEGQIDLLKTMLNNVNRPLFEGAAEGMKHLKQI